MEQNNNISGIDEALVVEQDETQRTRLSFCVHYRATRCFSINTSMQKDRYTILYI